MSEQGGVQFAIRGTGDRNNPVRRKLLKPFTGPELFVHFRMQYDAGGIDTPADGDGEFFVLWLDDVDGGDRAAHQGGVPNVGVHVAEQENRLMVRYHSSQQHFSRIALEGDREYQMIVRLGKSNAGPDQPFDQLALWADPLVHERENPAVKATSHDAIRRVQWLGFATGRKTEPTDTIRISDVRVAASWREILGLSAAVAAKAAPSAASPAPPQHVEKTVDFTTHVLPILETACFSCHGGADADSGVRLDVLDELLNQVTPRDAAASRLMELVRSTDLETRMPPPGEDRVALTRQQIETLGTWIDEGIDWDDGRLPTPVPQTDHWAFQPIVRPELPQVTNRGWIRTPVDAFIARRHELAGIGPAPLATPETLARRLSLNLTGLPGPRPRTAAAGIATAEVPPPPTTAAGDSTDDALVATRDPDRAEATHAVADVLVDELLSTVAYGERWGRHWLDLARWAESNGHQHNRERPHAWRYRDYVVQSFHSDKPYDRFLLEQIAGDELPYADEHLVATGFLAAARYSGNELDHEIQRNDILVDVVNTTAQTVLGLTLECAQCHTHKFDPFSLRDYYRLQAFFTPGQPGNVVLQSDPATAHALIESRWQIFDDVHRRLVAGRRASGVPEPVLVIPKSVFRAMKGPERTLFQRTEAAIAQLPQSWSWTSLTSADAPLAIAPHEMRWPLPRQGTGASAPKTYLRLRGDVKSVGPEVRPGWPAVFGKTPAGLARPRTTLATWMTSADNPLTARVWVNRIWQWHFGTGLVETSGDFGTQGTPPSHPQLLDWLACELIESGWSTKHIQRLIVGSNTFRQDSRFSPQGHAVDPDNRLLWRWRPRRLEAEAIRDSTLVVAGQLDPQAGGGSVPVSQAGRSRRRSIYLQQKRDNLPESLTVFDSPPAVASCSRRNVSTVAPQPLYLLNSPFMQTMAQSMAERVREAASDPDAQVQVAFEMALGRRAEASELQRATQYLADHTLTSFCHALMNLNEFLYVN